MGLASVYDGPTVHACMCPNVSNELRCWVFAYECICVSHVWHTSAGDGMSAGEPGDFLLTPRLQDGPRQLCDSMGFLSSLETARTPTPSCPPAPQLMVRTSSAQTVHVQCVLLPFCGITHSRMLLPDGPLHIGVVHACYAQAYCKLWGCPRSCCFQAGALFQCKMCFCRGALSLHSVLCQHTTWVWRWPPMKGFQH